MPTYNLPARSEHFNGRLCRQMHDDLNLAGMAQRTVHGYLRSVRQLVHQRCFDRPSLRQHPLRATRSIRWSRCQMPTC